jgi:hypothetical protein
MNFSILDWAILAFYIALIFGAGCTAIYFLVPGPREWTGAIGLFSYVAAFVGMVAGSLVGVHVKTVWKRWVILGGLIVAVPWVYHLFQGAFSGGQQWLYVWIPLLGLAFLFLLLISTSAIVKGFGDIRKMLKALQRSATSNR